MKRGKDLGMRFEAREVGWASPPPRRDISGDLGSCRFTTDADEMVSFWGATVEDVDFSGNRFWSFFADGSRFARCDFRDVTFDSVPRLGNNEGSVYAECSFDRADLTMDGSLGRVRFDRCTFDGATVNGWFSFEGEFVECRFATTVVDCTFHGTEPSWDRRPLDRLFRRPLRKNEFRGNDFRMAELSGTLFTRGIDISAQLWPEGHTYLRLDRVPERLARARAALQARAPCGRRDELLRLLEEFYEEVWEGQEEVFTDREGEPGSPFNELEKLIETAL